MELNPDHPVTKEVREQWHKFCALVMFKAGLSKVSITVKDIEEFARSKRTNIVSHVKNEVIELSLVDDKEAERLARKEGGLPS